MLRPGSEGGDYFGMRWGGESEDCGLEGLEDCGEALGGVHSCCLVEVFDKVGPE